jgi:hypothetical protein
MFGIHIDDLIEEVVDDLHELGFLFALAFEHLYHLQH